MNLSNKETIIKQSVKFDLILTKIHYYMNNYHDANNRISHRYKRHIDKVINGYTNLNNNPNQLFYMSFKDYIDHYSYENYENMMNNIKDYSDVYLLKLYEELIIDHVF